VSVQARPKEYAAALYDLAFETWTRQLGAAERALERDPALRGAVVDPARPPQEKLQKLARAAGTEFHPDVRSFLGTLLEAGQLDQLGSILAEFERLVHRRAERTMARVVSAVPLTAAEKETLQARLVGRFGPDLEFEFAVDPSIIGGVYLRVGDQVIDGTVAGKLAAMREHLSA
jgi:F-type H+-transporting ATPase subunit delta